MNALYMVILGVCLVAVFFERRTGPYIIGAFAVTALFSAHELVQSNLVELGTAQIACGFLWFWRWGSSYDLKSEETE